MQNNIFTFIVQEYTAVFKLEDKTLIISLNAADKDYQLGAKYTQDGVPNEVKFLFKTPAKLFAKLAKSQPKNMSIDSQMRLLVPIIFDDQQIILPLPLEKQEISLQKRLAKMARELKEKDQIIQRQQKEIKQLKSGQIHLNRPSFSQKAKQNQQGNEQYKKLKAKYDETRKNATNSMFQINKLEVLLQEANLQISKLQQELKLTKENTDKIVTNVKLQCQRQLLKKQIQLQQIQKKENSKQTSPQKIESPLVQVIGLQLIEQAKQIYTKFQFNWNNNSNFSDNYKFSGKKVKKIDSSSYDHHQIYSYQRLPKEGKIQVVFKVLSYGEETSDIILGILAASRKMQEFSGGRNHKKSVGYWSDNQHKSGTIYVDGVKDIQDKQLFINGGHQLRIKIDLDEGKIRWVRGKKQFVTNIFENYKNQNLHIFVALKYQNDQISVE